MIKGQDDTGAYDTILIRPGAYDSIIRKATSPSIGEVAQYFPRGGSMTVSQVV